MIVIVGNTIERESLTKTLWRCPRCGRQFQKKNQWHSCISYSVDDHFQDRPIYLRETFDFLLAKMKQYGPIRIDAVKSSINFVGKYHFAAVHVLNDNLKLGFLLDRDINDERIIRKEKLGEANYHYHVKLAHKKDIDAKILGWLKEAYSLRK